MRHGEKQLCILPICPLPPTFMRSVYISPQSKGMSTCYQLLTFRPTHVLDSRALFVLVQIISAGSTTLKTSLSFHHHTITTTTLLSSPLPLIFRVLLAFLSVPIDIKQG